MTAIEFNHVSKQYRLGLVSTKTLSHDIRRWWITSVLGKEDPYLKIGETNDRASKGTSEYVWALRDIDFKVEQGDVVGIIGKNGAGKSTLLKLLSRVTGPTTGTIRAHGRIGSLLEVGTGFHGEMTGRENIFMNGAILGMTRNEIQAKLDEIIDFSGCERYIDTPVKRYSSGMTVRLGFAVAAFLEPEILVVDEVLAVGDAEFQKKAIGKMKDVSQGQGRTVLFVSHNMGSIRSLCTSGVMLEKGTMKYRSNNINEVVDYYIKSSYAQEYTDMAHAKRFASSSVFAFTDVKYLDLEDNETIPTTGKTLKIRVYFTVKEKILPHVRIAVTIRDVFGDPVMILNSEVAGYELTLNPSQSYIDCVIPRFPLSNGGYYMNLYASSNNIAIDWVEGGKELMVLANDYYQSGRLIDEQFQGKVVLVDQKWNLDDN